LSTIFSGERWTIQRFVSGFANNAFLITCVRTGKSVIIDTPGNPVELIAAARSTSVEAVLVTHGHRDHLEGFDAVTGEFDVPVGIGNGDRGSLPGTSEELPELLEISTGSLVEVGDIVLRPMATPGHTPGSTCFVLGGSLESENAAAPGENFSHVFSGDTLFPGGPGRSASHQALRQMIDSISTQIFTLPDSTVVLPGHGEFTTVGESKPEYAVFASNPLDASLSGDVTWE
jgi:hydroxyacylglutathione hydrolase